MHKTLCTVLNAAVVVLFWGFLMDMFIPSITCKFWTKIKRLSCLRSMTGLMNEWVDELVTDDL